MVVHVHCTMYKVVHVHCTMYVSKKSLRESQLGNLKSQGTYFKVDPVLKTNATFHKILDLCVSLQQTGRNPVYFKLYRSYVVRTLELKLNL